MEETGKRVFSIGPCLGRGGFGEVYRARMRSPGGLESEVAVKVLRGDLDPESQSVQRLRDEGRVLARLDHPVILRVHDLVTLDGRVALIAEYVEGEDLDGCVVGEDRMPVRALLECVAAVAGALDVAWQAKDAQGEPFRLVHRDIKPSNIRIAKHGHVKLLDFGIARSDAMSREARTQTDMVVGSPHYLAPERFLSPAADPASDVFALGCVLFEGLTGLRLYGEVSVLMMSAAALDADRHAAFIHERLTRLPAALDPRVTRLTERLLAYNPADRPTAVELAALCEHLVDALGGVRLTTWARGRRWPAPAPVQGPLEGQTLTEGTTIHTVATQLPPAQVADSLAFARPTDSSSQVRRATGSGMAVAAAGSVVLGGAGLVVAFALGLLVWWVWAPGAESPKAGVHAALPVIAVEARPSAEVVEPMEAPAPARPSAGSSAPNVITAGPDTSPAVEAAPVASTPPPAAAIAPPTVEVAPPQVVRVPAAAAPRSADPAPTQAEVAVVGDVEVSLVQGDRRVALPGAAPAGTWQVEAKFPGRGPAPAGEVRLQAAQRYTLACSSRMLRCDLR